MRRFELFTTEELAMLGVAITMAGIEEFPEIRPLLTEVSAELKLRQDQTRND